MIALFACGSVLCPPVCWHKLNVHTDTICSPNSVRAFLCEFLFVMIYVERGSIVKYYMQQEKEEKT